jgi:hypothetical protein
MPRSAWDMDQSSDGTAGSLIVTEVDVPANPTLTA